MFLKEKVVVGKKKEQRFWQNSGKKKFKNKNRLNKKFAKSLNLYVGRSEKVGNAL